MGASLRFKSRVPRPRRAAEQERFIRSCHLRSLHHERVRLRRGAPGAAAVRCRGSGAMPAALALVPLLGAPLFLSLSACALYLDWRLQRLENASSVGTSVGGPVLVRYLSIATFDTKGAPHALFAAACVTYAVILSLTAAWQARLLVGTSRYRPPRHRHPVDPRLVSCNVLDRRL